MKDCEAAISKRESRESLDETVRFGGFTIYEVTETESLMELNSAINSVMENLKVCFFFRDSVNFFLEFSGKVLGGSDYLQNRKR